MTKLLTLAKQLRRDAHSGWNWNAPKRFEDLPDRAKDIWIGRAIRETLEEKAKP